MSTKAKPTAKKEEAKSSLVPKLRFPEFRGTEAWHFISLDSACEILNNRRRPITGNDRTPGPYPYYGASGIVDYVSDFIFDERLLLVGEDGAKWGAFEKTAFIADGKYWVNNHAHVLKPSVANDTFLENYLTMQDLSPFVTGAAPPKLTLGKLRSIPVPLPPRSTEQEKIAECLSSADELVAAQARKVDALKTHKKGLMQQLFPREGETQPRLRFPEFHNGGEWRVKKLEEIGRVIRGASPRPKGDPRFYGGPVPRLMVQDVTRDGKWVTPRIDSLTEEGARLSRPCPAGTLTIVCSGNVGIVSFLAVDACIHDGFLALVDINESIAAKDFLFHTLSTLKEQFEKGATHGGVFTNLTTSGIDQFEITCPDIAEQQRIATCLSSLDASITAETQELEVLKTHKKGLMQQLFPSSEEI